MDQGQSLSNHSRLEKPEVRPFEETHSSFGLFLASAAQADIAKADAISRRPHGQKAMHVAQPTQTLPRFLAGIAETADGAKPNQVLAVRENFTVPLNHSYLNHELVLKSLEAKNPTFKKNTAADGTQNLTEVSGVKLSFHTFGRDQKLDVRSIAINKEPDGRTHYQLQVDNPLPPEVEKVFNSPSTLPLNFSVDARGRVAYPRDSEVLHSLSQNVDTTLPGLVLRDALTDAGDVAKFIETNPAWVKNIMAPFMSRFGTYLKSDFDPSVVLNTVQPDKTAGAGKSDQPQPAAKKYHSRYCSR